MRERIPIIDLFAGPGGLGEGFSSLTDSAGDRIFQILMSVEMEASAHSTLRMRSFFRKIYDIDGEIPKLYLDYLSDPSPSHLSRLQEAFPDQWAEADYEAVQATLVEGDETLVEEALRRLQGYTGPKVIIGGPPCQAYSLVGRSRRAHDQKGLQSDVKQTLYKCYLQFLNAVRPEVFVMENVKGILSAQLHNEGVLGLIRADIEEAGYTLHSLAVADPQKPTDYVVKAERYGIPQARHRVILLGIRNDLDVKPTQLRQHPEATVRDALHELPSLRSGFSRRSEGNDSDWADYILTAARLISDHYPHTDLADELIGLTDDALPSRISAGHVQTNDTATPLSDWYRGRLAAVGSDVLTNHIARSHMAKDLDRYLFCSVFAQVHDRPAKLEDFPAYLLPDHKNVTGSRDLKTVGFSDRFRTQLYDHPSTTVTSHISKDGHYFIHPDFRQCRSLTVREAARLQTFPDDYYFEGNRTAQYQQVGNAVPPLLANQIAKVVAQCLKIPADDYFDRLKQA